MLCRHPVGVARPSLTSAGKVILVTGPQNVNRQPAEPPGIAIQTDPVIPPSVERPGFSPPCCDSHSVFQWVVLPTCP